MNCQRVEKLLLKSFDGLLDKHQTEILEKHLGSCPECLSMKEEYETILGILKTSSYPEPKPSFWERLQPKLRGKQMVNPWAQWKLWGLRAVPVALFIVVILAGVLTFIDLRQPDELSSSEAFLLQNKNPLQGSSSILDEEKVEEANMMLIFASLEEPQTTTRKKP
jgi:predicted anti-sigma-YlaC factor YlaD